MHHDSDNLVDFFRNIDKQPLAHSLDGKLEIVDRRIDTFSFDLFKERSPLYIVTSELFMHIKADQQAFIKMLGPSKVLMIFETTHDFYEGNEFTPFYSVLNKKNTTRIVMYMVRVVNAYDKGIEFNTMIHGLLFEKKKQFLALNMSTEGTNSLINNVNLLPGYQAIDIDVISEYVKSKIAKYGESYKYKFGLVTIDDEFDFYSIITVIFSLPDPNSTDIRLKESTLYAVCVYIPQLIVMLLPRDAAIQSWSATISEMAMKKGIISIELVDQIVDYILRTVYDTVRIRFID